MTTPHPGATAPQAPLDRNLLAEAAKLAYVDAHNKDSNFSAGPLAEIERYIRAAHAVGVTQGMHASPAAATQPCASAYPNQSYQCPVAEVIVSHVRPGLDGLCTAEIASAERLPVGAELFLHPPRELDHQAFVADACARIKAADDAAADNDYMLDSDDCIQVLRGEWKGPLRNDYPQKPEHPELAQAVQAAGQGELVAWQQRRARRVANDVVTDWSPWYPVTTHHVQQAQKDAPSHIPHERRPLYTGPVDGVDPGQHEVLRQAATQALAAMDYMLRNGEWYRAQERADALREALKAGPVPYQPAKH